MAVLVETKTFESRRAAGEIHPSRTKHVTPLGHT
jgi:hypothetical protein